MRAIIVLTACLVLMSACQREPVGEPVIAEAAPRPLDVILILDQSSSMRWTDPENNRVGASRFFVEFLGSYWADEQDHRIGLVNFGSRRPPNPEDETHPLISLDTANIAERNILLEKIKPLDLLFTSFIDAFRTSRRLFDQAPTETERQRVIVLLTDGEPDDTRKLTRAAYFEELIRYFNDSLAGCNLHVIGLDINDEYWTGTLPYWQRITDNTEQMKSADERAFKETFWRVVSRELEGAADRWEPIPEGGLRVELPPYLEAVTFTVHKELPEAEVVITAPGELVLSDRTPGTRRALSTSRTEVWRVEEPTAGVWTCEVQRGAGRVEVGTVRIPVQPRLVYPGATHPQGKPFPIVASFLRKDGRPIKELAAFRPTMYASVKLPGEAESRHFDLISTDKPGLFYSAETLSASLPGDYAITLSMKAERPVTDTTYTTSVQAVHYLAILAPEYGERQSWLQKLPVQAQVRLAGEAINPSEAFRSNLNAMLFCQVFGEAGETIYSGHLEYLGGERDARFGGEFPPIHQDGRYRLVMTLDAEGRDGRDYSYTNRSAPLYFTRRMNALDFVAFRWYIVLVVLLFALLVWDWQRIGRRTGWWGWRFGGPRLSGQLEITVDGEEPLLVTLSGRWKILKEHGVMLVARSESEQEPDGTTTTSTVMYITGPTGCEKLDENSRLKSATGKTLSWMP